MDVTVRRHADKATRTLAYAPTPGEAATNAWSVDCLIRACYELEVKGFGQPARSPPELGRMVRGLERARARKSSLAVRHGSQTLRLVPWW
uniref:Uncharacterized protein n=1 Tax=Bionectria ochroleuca TaxID=29856 RepID=A0A0B7KM38_BIOOC